MNKELTDIMDIVLRSIISLITLFLVTKMLGKKQVSQLSLFDYVIGISIGNFAAEATINLDSGYLHGVVAVFMFGFVAYLVNILTMKSIWLRRFFMGTPTILIQNGKILEKGLKKVKFDMNDLLEVARDAGYFDLSEISFAIMEANGKVSFLLKGENQIPTFKDLNIKSKNKSLCANLVIDGKIMKNNLFNINKTEEWLIKELKEKGYQKLDKILLVTLDSKDKLTIYERNKNIKSINILE